MAYLIGGVEVPADVFILLADGPGPDDSIHDLDWAETEYQRLKAEQLKDAVYSLEVFGVSVWVTPPGTNERRMETQRQVRAFDQHQRLFDSQRASSPEHEAELISEFIEKYKISADRITIDG